MRAVDIVESPLAWLVVLVALVGSLFACRDWPARILFALVMPVLFAFLWIICYMALGCFSAPLDGLVPGEALGLLVGALATIVTGVTFILQVLSMCRDSAAAAYGYSCSFRGKRSLPREPTLSHLPTRRRWSG